MEYTPRKFIIHPETKNMVVVETEHNAYTEETKKQRRVQMAEVSFRGFSLILIRFFWKL